MNIKHAFASLKFHNYRLWFFGQMISLFGTWMQATAQGFLIYQLTSSPFYLGLVGFFAGLPTWFFTFYGGHVSDHMNRKKLLLITQISMMFLALILSILTFLNVVKPWHILVLAFLLGIATSFDAPARHSFVVDLVDKSHMANAISLNTTMFNLSMIIGPAAAGIAYATLGAGWCFLLNCISFIAVIIALLLMKIQSSPTKKDSSFKVGFKELKTYLHAKPAIIVLLAVLAVTVMFGAAYIAIIPAWAVDILRGDVKTNGLMLAIRGVGAVGASLWLGIYGVRNEKKLKLVSLLSPLIIILFAITSNLIFSFVLLFALGSSFVYLANSANIIIQENTEDHFRGRVMGAYSFVFFASMPIASLWIGIAAQYLGLRIAVFISAILSFLLAAIIWIKSKTFFETKV